MRKRILIFTFLAAITLPLHGVVAEQGNFDDWKNQPTGQFTNAETTFKQVKQMLHERYLDAKLTDEQLYQAATDGMLRSLNGSSKNVYNKLLTPAELDEMKTDLKGKFTGIGTEIKFDEQSGLTEVIGVTPGSPAERAGIRAGDQIVSVNGKLGKGLQFRDVVYAIRGKPGEKVRLKILRGDSMITKEVVRETQSWASVTSAMVGHAGVVAISNFNETTGANFEKALRALKDKGMTSLILDLRGNSGGIFDGAVAAAGFLVPKGNVVVRLDKRDGTEEAIRSTTEPVISENLPIAVLVNEETASSAELLTASLADNLGAKVIGARTHGKWNVQTIEDLPNGFAVRFTTGNFKSPNGHAFPDVGIEPDVLVASSATSTHGRFNPDELSNHLEADATLRAAMNLFEKTPPSND